MARHETYEEIAPMSSDGTRAEAALEESFRPRARLLQLLEDQLIGSPRLAIFELVKNAYDADATTAEVRMRNLASDRASIQVRDNGDGMSLTTLRDIWLAVFLDEPHLQRCWRSSSRRKKVAAWRSMRLAGQLPVLGLELEDPLPVADLLAGNVRGRLARAGTYRGHGAGRGSLSPPHPPPQRLGMDVELASDPRDRSTPRARVTPRVQSQTRRALLQLLGVLPWCRHGPDPSGSSASTKPGVDHTRPPPC